MLGLRKGLCALKLDLSLFLTAPFGLIKGIISFSMLILRSDGLKKEQRWCPLSYHGNKF